MPGQFRQQHLQELMGELPVLKPDAHSQQRGPRQTASLDHLRDEVRRINELGMGRKPTANDVEIRGLKCDEVIVDDLGQSNQEPTGNR